jgi:hypothetical protein
MSELALYDANHGCWKLGPRADKERYMIVSFEGIVRQAVEIDSIEPVTRGNRSVVLGSILRAGHPVFDKYVGKTSPVQGMRNPGTSSLAMTSARSTTASTRSARFPISSTGSTSCGDTSATTDKPKPHDLLMTLGTTSRTA